MSWGTKKFKEWAWDSRVARSGLYDLKLSNGTRTKLMAYICLVEISVPMHEIPLLSIWKI